VRTCRTQRALLASLLWAASADATGCGTRAAARPDTSQAAVALSEGEAVEFQTRAQAFYERLSKRRVNTIATFQDQALREYFRSESAFSDYYANLAQALADAHFERNRPLESELHEFVLEGPGLARVRYRFVGDNGLPLRFWSTSLEREDHWERVDGAWWIVPGKL
jgi:hypothetical protein